jgi:thiosulfate reductase cytochrome b subunit
MCVCYRPLDMAELLRHTAIVRITHWVNSISFLALLTSGVAILFAHPRLYWGETGAFGSPALIELPLPLNLDQSGWGRSLHFLSAWICVLNGTVYVGSGMIARHFTRNTLPEADGVTSDRYTPMQRITYLAVVFLLFPLMILTGLAMSPAVRAAVPMIVGVFGGHQSSRTIHFFVTNLLIGFFIIHLIMVSLAGFSTRTRAMITGREARSKESL